MDPNVSNAVIDRYGAERRTRAYRLLLQGGAPVSAMTMRRWTLAVQVAIEVRSSCPYVHPLRCWFRLIARMMAIRLTYCQGHWSPEGRLPESALAFFRERLNYNDL